jgi:hypothetical protein
VLIGPAIATAAVPVARVAATTVASNVAYRWPALANLLVSGASLLWFEDAVMKLVGTLNPNTDIIAPAPAGTWGLYDTLPVSYLEDRKVVVKIQNGVWNPDHDCIGILPSFAGASASPTFGYQCYADGFQPAPGAQVMYTFDVPLSLSAQPTSQWTGFRIFTAKSDGTEQKNVLPGQFDFVLVAPSSVAVGNFVADPDRRIYSTGGCRYPEGGTVNGQTVAAGYSTYADAKYSPVYTQATGSGKIIRPTCRGTGGILIGMQADLQTKNTNNTWITTIPKLYETKYTNPATADEDTPACTSGANANCVLLPADITSTTAPATTTITYPNPTSTTGTENTIGCSLSLNIASTAACVLEWAFVPTTLQTKVQEVKAAANGSAFGTVADLVPIFTAPFTALNTASASPIDCRGPKITLDFIPGSGDLYPFYACPDSINGQISTWVNNISKIVVIFGGLYAISGILLGAFGARSSLPKLGRNK